MSAITSREHRAWAGKVRQLLAKYREIELLVRIGEYKAGSDAAADEALRKNDAINKFLRQTTDEKVAFEETLDALQELAS
jgi:Flagellar biosynthesis/type III secretory pathway ATPase